MCCMRLERCLIKDQPKITNSFLDASYDGYETTYCFTGVAGSCCPHFLRRHQRAGIRDFGQILTKLGKNMENFFLVAIILSRSSEAF